MVVDGLQARLHAIGKLPDIVDRNQRLTELARGSSLFGCVLKKDTKKVSTIEDLRSLVYGLNKFRNSKEYSRGAKILLFFYVPRGWRAYTGEVELAKYLKKYENRDREIKTAWEKKLTAGYTPAEGEKAPYEEHPVHPSQKDKWGPLATRAINGIRVVPYRTVALVDGVLEAGYDYRLFTDKEAMQPATTICFVIDKASGQLQTWQPGRYAEEGEHKRARLIISSEEITDEVG